MNELQSYDNVNVKSMFEVMNADKTIQEEFEKYVRRCIEVTWWMSACNPPMAISTDHTRFDRRIHQKFDGKGSFIKCFLWPCLYFSEEYKKNDGSVMNKGEVLLKETEHSEQTTTLVTNKSTNIDKKPGTVQRHHENEFPRERLVDQKQQREAELREEQKAELEHYNQQRQQQQHKNNRYNDQRSQFNKSASSSSPSSSRYDGRNNEQSAV